MGRSGNRLTSAGNGTGGYSAVLAATSTGMGKEVKDQAVPARSFSKSQRRMVMLGMLQGGQQKGGDPPGPCQTQ